MIKFANFFVIVFLFLFTNRRGLQIEPRLKVKKDDGRESAFLNLVL